MITPVKISNRKAAQAVNNGFAQILLPWPVARLGEYGANTSTDADMDAYVAGTIDNTDTDVEIGGICAGYDQRIGPAIVLRIVPRNRFGGARQ